MLNCVREMKDSKEKQIMYCGFFFSDETKQKFQEWKDYDDSLDMFCEVDGKYPKKNFWGGEGGGL